jgi:hypothetical protein
MLKYFTPAVAIFFFLALSTFPVYGQWVTLLDKNMSQWQTYLSYRHQNNYNGNVPKGTDGKEMAPVGYDKDPSGVFSVLNEPEGLVLRVSGEIYGCIFTKQEFENYHLKLQFKWGQKKYEPRLNKLKDSGILYHSTGPAGAEYWRTWMLSQEFQIMEGHMGDYWCQANSVIDIRSFPSEGVMSAVADANQPYRTYKSGSDYYCMRSQDYESPAGDWNTLELICYQGKSLHIVNGHVVMVLQNSGYVKPDGERVAMTKGKIQLQSEAAEAFFRDINIMKLDRMPEVYQKFFEKL